VIDELDINNIYLGIEFESKRSKNGNWTTIMGNLSKGPKTEGKKGKTVLIKKLILNNINIELAYRREGEITTLKPVRQIVLTDVSSEEGKLTDVITKIIIDQMLQKIFSIENLQNMLEDILNPEMSPVEKALSPFKGLFK
jgi:hypothetical protein